MWNGTAAISKPRPVISMAAPIEREHLVVQAPLPSAPDLVEAQRAGGAVENAEPVEQDRAEPTEPSTRYLRPASSDALLRVSKAHSR